MNRGHEGLALTLLTVNVNGVGSAGKAGRLLSYQQHLPGGSDATFVQECKQSSKATLEATIQAGAGAGTPWRGELAYSPGTDASCGTAIMARPSGAAGLVVRQAARTDTAGRVVCWDWDVLHHRLRLVSVYAPNDPGAREAFLAGLADYFDTDRSLLVAGDFNCILSASEESAACAGRQRGQQQLQELMSAHDLVDPWAQLNSNNAGFTHPATPKQCSFARLDRWLLSSAALPWVSSLQLLPGAPGDHHGVLLRLQLPDLPPVGRRGWRFPVYLLHHPGLKQQLLDAVKARAESITGSPAAQGAQSQDVWESLKAAVKTEATQVHREHVRRCRAAVTAAQDVAQDALRFLSQHPSSPEAQQSATAAGQAAQAAVKASADSKRMAQGAVFAHLGERSTRAFHALGKLVAPQAPLTALSVPGTAEPVPLTGRNCKDVITAAATAMYSSNSPTGLFRVGEVDAAAQDTLLQHLQRRLSPELRDAVDATSQGGTMGEAELLAALGQCATGKAPGTDGLPYEVYKALWPVLGKWLLAAANAAFTDAQAAAQSPDPAAQMMAALPRSWLQGIITLLYKGKRLPREVLTSHRPITLLNSDYKLVAKAFSNRLQPALAELIDALQSAFLCGRDPRDNVVFLQAMLEWLGASGQPGALLLLDVEKAYDRVHRPWVLKVARAMGFGPHTLVWMQLFMAEGTASVVVNGHQSAWFPVRNGLQQGGTLSPVLWTITLEPLTSYCHHLVRSGALHTPNLPDGTPAPPVSHHADDTHLLVTDADEDGPVANAALELFCRASNAKIHPTKSKGITLGSHRLIVGAHLPTGAEFISPDSRDPPRHLGVPITGDRELAAELCYEARLSRLKGMAVRWREHGLSMVGRVHIAKQVLGNSLAYHFSFVPLGPELLRRLQRVMDDFAACSPLPEDVSLAGQGHVVLLPKTQVACLSRAEGGIGHVDLQAASTALMAKTLAQLAQPGQRPWQRLVRGLLTAAAPSGTQGWGWVYGTCPIPTTLTPLLAAWVQAYRATHPERRPLDPAVDDPRAVLAEPLFYNPRLIHPATEQPFPAPPNLPPGSPLTVGQLREAGTTLWTQPPWAALASAMPDDWHTAIPPDPLSGQLEEGPGWRVSPRQDWALSPEGRAFRVLESGRVLPVPEGGAGPAADPSWPQACVLDCRKPKALWTLEEREAYRQAPREEKAAAWPREPQMLGPWRDLQCYPAAHGHGKLSLVEYEVCNTRQLLTTRRVTTGLEAQPVPLIPAAWPRQPGLTSPSGAGPSAPTSALAAMELAWTQQLQTGGPWTVGPTPLWLRPRQDPQRLVDRQRREERYRRRGMAGLLDPGGSSSQGNGGGGEGLSSGGPGGAGAPGEARRERSASPALEMVEGLPSAPAAALAAGPVPALPAAAPLVRAPGSPVPSAGLAAIGTTMDSAAERAQMWRRLWACPAGNRAKVLGWRLAHARLPCGLYLATKRGPGTGPSGPRHLCAAPSCAQLAGRGRPRDSLTHAFLACPAMAPARQWLGQLWAAISGGQEPPLDDAAVMLGDHPTAWEQHPARADGGQSTGQVRLWGAVRLTFLLAMWCAHQTGDPQERTARAVVQATVQELQQRMREQFATAALPDGILDSLPIQLLSADLQQTKLADFTAVWAHRGVLCTVEQAAGNSPPSLNIKLSMAHPVPAPVAT